MSACESSLSPSQLPCLTHKCMHVLNGKKKRECLQRVVGGLCVRGSF